MTAPVPAWRTLPAEAHLAQMMGTIPAWMYPEPNPFGVVLEGALDDAQCDELIRCVSTEDTYKVQRCGAQTRQYEDEHEHVLEPLATIAMTVNQRWWGYEVANCKGWLQTYEKGGHYARHMDAAAGMSRKLSAVAMVSGPADYTGGDLIIEAVPGFMEFTIPHTRGTVVVFQPWLIHYVSTVTSGLRRTVNLGFWGPRLR